MVTADKTDADTDAATAGKLDSGESIFVTAQDGLRLHVRTFGERTAPGLAVVCLPGLSRTVADFDQLAPMLVREFATNTASDRDRLTRPRPIRL